MKKTIHENVRYYGTIDTTGFNDFQMSWFTRKKIEYIIKHKQLGYCVRIYPQELDAIKQTMSVLLTVWPDNDSYNFVKSFNLNGIYEEKLTLTEV